MKCSKCGADTPAGRKFCEECGAPLVATGVPGQAKPNATGAKPSQGGPQPHYASGKPHTQTSSGQMPHSGTSPQPAAAGGQSAQSGKGGMGRIIGLIAMVVFVFIVFSMCSSLGNMVGSISIPSGSQANNNGNNNAAASAGVTSPTAHLMSESDAAKSGDSWTVLFYMCGSDLESDSGLATYNLQELAQADLGDNVKFVVEAGGARKWRNTAMNAKYLTRAVIDSRGFNVVDKLPKASMAIPDTLSDFVSWGVDAYPADHYMLIFWDHGAGSVLGVCQDELFPGKSWSSSDTLTLTEIDAALGKAGVDFDLVGFDTCLMATIETASMLSSRAKYMVASEETEPGYGWDYVAFPEWLSSHTGTDGALLGKQICDSYYAKCRKFGVADMATLSVVDLSQMGTLITAFQGASEEMAQATVSSRDLRLLYQGACRSERFGGDTVYNMVDLGDLMNHTNGVVKEYADDVIDAIGKAVVYQVHGRSRSGATGLSVFYPLDTSMGDMFFGYLDIVGNIPYAQFLAVMYGKYNSVDWNKYTDSVSMKGVPLKAGDISIQHTEAVNGDGRLEMSVSEGLDNVAQVESEVSLFLPDQRTVVYLGTDYNVESPSDGVYVDSFDGKWMTIGGAWVSCQLLEHADDHDLYSVPIRLNGLKTNLIVMHDLNEDAYEIECACGDPNEGVSGKSVRALKEGDIIEFVFAAQVLGEGAEPFEFAMGKVTYGSDVTVERADLGEGTYMFSFRITDVLGGETETGLYARTYDANGGATTQTLDEYLS